MQDVELQAEAAARVQAAAAKAEAEAAWWAMVTHIKRGYDWWAMVRDEWREVSDDDMIKWCDADTILLADLNRNTVFPFVAVQRPVMPFTNVNANADSSVSSSANAEDDVR